MWNKPAQGQLPYPHQVVIAITPEGKEAEMYRIGNLWFLNSVYGSVQYRNEQDAPLPA
jgi:hypothetical protein